MNDEIIHFFHKTLGTLKDGKAPPIFSGPQPISIERKHLPTLYNNPYIVCEKTDGVRNVIVCTTYKGKPVSVLLNRALKIKPIKIGFPSSAYKGTILDGELVKGSLFMVYDAMMVAGNNLMDKNFMGRLEKISYFLKATSKSKENSVQIRLKNFFITEDFEEFQNDFLPTLKYKTDGLVFTPLNDPIRIGTHETMFKWKPRDLNTIDFQVKDSGKTWGLYIQDRGVLIFQSELPKSYKSPWLKENNIFECQYMVDDNIPWWKPVGLRTDKHHPNNRRTFFRTLVNIRENIKDEEFVNLFKK